MLSILHLSDLHRDPANPISNSVLIDSLERDRDRYTCDANNPVQSPDLVVVTGDIVQGVKSGTPNADDVLRKQYDEATIFLGDLANRFLAGDRSRLVLVPGNHDVSDDVFRRCLSPIDIQSRSSRMLIQELFSPRSLMRWSWPEFQFYEITDVDLYNLRFKAFADFYEEFYQGERQFSLDPTEQFDIFDYPEFGVTIVGFCSCYNNDLLNRQGAIHPDCIGDASTRLRRPEYQDRLRIAAWHHNTEGPPMQVDYMDPEIIQNLIDCGISVGLHGHQHRPEFLDTRFKHGPDRRITIVSSGTLCGDAAFHHARAYNLIEIDVAGRSGKVHLREMQNADLQLPIWGVRSMSPGFESFLSFKFDAPPKPYVSADSVTMDLIQANKHLDSGDDDAAAKLLRPLAGSNELARRLLLDCEVRLKNANGILSLFMPPTADAEVIAVLDALWAEGKYDELRLVLELPIVSTSNDPSVIEMRTKYEAKLKR